MSGWPQRCVAAVGRAGWLLVHGAHGIVSDTVEQDRLAGDRLAAAFERLGWRPIATLALLGLMIGLASGIAAARTLHSFYAERLVEPLVSRVLARDVVPLLIGVFAAGRVAVETAVRFGAMRLGSELDALRSTGHDPVRYVIAPALAAVVMATPLQFVTVFACAWLGFAVVLDLSVVTSLPVLAHTALAIQTFRALLWGLLKTLVYNVGALVVGARAGLDDRRGIAALGREATHAFTGGLLLVIAIGVFSVLIQ